ncbi:carbohydrate-binding module family 52 protein [Collybiopsis luxurians FD-317 M1]|uniref:Carbohydrate-binding module family 52 protein n=1 Tax=Collybiopsis luxurians FD-317 M1 TaxID=944289 RepID=A0A0D0B1R9_9AGAR|nr:carbohydrate-binding module family 52 protein [Collybiopsis luxurians FD-317 M1]
MAPLISVVLTALVAGVVAQSETLLNCGDSRYYPSQYTCFDSNFLCPILNGDIYIRCGDACYSTSQYSCSDNTLEPYNPNGPETLEDCGDARFYPSQATARMANWPLFPLPRVLGITGSVKFATTKVALS